MTDPLEHRDCEANLLDATAPRFAPFDGGMNPKDVVGVSVTIETVVGFDALAATRAGGQACL